MRRSMSAALLLSVLVALPRFAHEIPYSITPGSGPTAGGTEVTVKGNFGQWPYTVFFGDTAAKDTRRVDEHTLVATTPAQLPGRVEVRVFEYDLFLATGLVFEFVGDPPAGAFDRFLLPVFTPPVRGAFGSEFRTSLRIMSTGTREFDVFGLPGNCIILCIDPELADPVRLSPLRPLDETSFAVIGNPGRFIYITPENSRYFSASLRVYDTSRAAENFGTTIPVVPAWQFRTTSFGLLNIPTDPRFRNTLRLYATAPTSVRIDAIGEESITVALSGGNNLHQPAYAQLTFSGTEAGLKDLVIVPAAKGPPVWGFVSVTNNLTQHITTVTPR